MIRAIHFSSAAAAARFVKALARPTEFQRERAYGPEYDTGSFIQRRGSVVRTNAGLHIIREGFLRCHSEGMVSRGEE